MSVSGRPFSTRTPGRRTASGRRTGSSLPSRTTEHVKSVCIGYIPGDPITYPEFTAAFHCPRQPLRVTDANFGFLTDAVCDLDNLDSMCVVQSAADLLKPFCDRSTNKGYCAIKSAVPDLSNGRCSKMARKYLVLKVKYSCGKWTNSGYSWMKILSGCDVLGTRLIWEGSWVSFH